MAVADGSSNSKTIVHFSDPNSTFDDVAPLIRNRLPLGNLHWKSPTRPLRSIEELDVSLEKEQSQPASDPTSFRRHQIPGLRQTPFVKVLLLRCDDKEKYKESVRKEAKDWVKSLGVSTSGKSTTKGQERHDAFEYIILHVVYAGTTAASQPKSSKHISVEATESTDSVNSKSKWTGKSTSTVFDKLRADFASSSKAPFERVAQVRLIDPAKPSTALSPLEVEEQWQDLVEKLKVAILQSFDARVAQYEEDIRERESQRSLPGWNFCTFFILKEGLARGFENVGLLEDALQLYEELDVGLDTVIQDQAKNDSIDAANSLLPHSTDLKDIIRAVLESPGGHEHDDAAIELSLQAWVVREASQFPWKLERRNYQQMILTNQVSALDFRIYMFIRQMQIMLRRASTITPVTKSKPNRSSISRWDADLLSEICERSIKFMNLAARNLRQDLLAAWGGSQGLPQDELTRQKVAIDNIVASWKWSSLLQTLSECQIISSLSKISDGVNGRLPDGDWAHAKHNSSISTVSSGATTVVTDGDSMSKEQDIFMQLRIVKGSKTEFLFWAAELFSAMRNILIQVGERANTLATLYDANAGVEDLDDVARSKAGIRSPTLTAIIHEPSSAVEVYKLLTIYACQCYTTAGKPRASRQLLFDLAKLEMRSSNHDAALDWLDTVRELLDTPPRTSLDRSMLDLYIKCLRSAGRERDLAQALFVSLQTPVVNGRGFPTVSDLWEELRLVTDTIEPVQFAFDSLFAIKTFDNRISHHDTRDGCAVSLVLRCLTSLSDLGEVQVELECWSKIQRQPSTLRFWTCVNASVVDGEIELTLRSKTTLEGWYEAKSLNLSFGNLHFRHDLNTRLALDDKDKALDAVPTLPTSIYVYPRNEAPSIQASRVAEIDLSHKRSVATDIFWGSNHINTALLRLKPATAGLRLDLLSAVEVRSNSFHVSRTDEGYFFSFQDLEAGSQIALEIPYSFDNDNATSVTLLVDMKYSSEGEDYELYDQLTFSNLLPIAVNVQDVFQSSGIFSRFTFAPSRPSPISIVNCTLTPREDSVVVKGSKWKSAVDAFPKQPVSWVVQILPGDKQSKTPLLLDVAYRCMDEAILNLIMDNFSGVLKTGPYAYASRPLGSHLRGKLRTLLTEAEIELIALTSEIEIWSYEQLDWDTILYVFGKYDRAEIERWLRHWHMVSEIIPLQSPVTPLQRLRLLVDSPTTQVLVTSSLALMQSHPCVVGQPVMAQLTVSVKSHLEVEAEVSAEVTGQNESWLVGGQRKVTFLAAAKQCQSTVVLIAQRTGSLLLPGIDVRCRHANTKDPRPISFEVENPTSALVVQVRSNLQSTTFGLGDGENADGHWLIDSRHAHLQP